MVNMHCLSGNPLCGLTVLTLKTCTLMDATYKFRPGEIATHQQV